MSVVIPLTLELPPRRRLRYISGLFVAVLGAVAVLAGVPSAHAAERGNADTRGNSASAKLCQKGGWQDLVSAAGASYASEDQCVSYGAQGGTLVPESVVAPCLEGGWEDVITADGESFADEDACRRYAAGGGTVEAKPTSDPRCSDGGYLDLYRQDGSGFSSDADCNAYVAAGGHLVGLRIRTERLNDGVMYVFTEGFGLAPGSHVQDCGRYRYGSMTCLPGTVAADGTFNGQFSANCGNDATVWAVGTTAAGATVTSREVFVC